MLIYLVGTGVTSYSLHPGFIYDGMPTNVNQDQEEDKPSPFMTLAAHLMRAFKLYV